MCLPRGESASAESDPGAGCCLWCTDPVCVCVCMCVCVCVDVCVCVCVCVDVCMRMRVGEMSMNASLAAYVGLLCIPSMFLRTHKN